MRCRRGTTIDHPQLNRAGADVMMQFMRLATPGDDARSVTKMTYMVIDFDVRDGAATVDRTIAMYATEIALATIGTIDFRNEALDLGAALNAGEGIRKDVGARARGLRLTGTFAEPRVSANVTGLVISAGLTSATVAGAFATGGLPLLVQSTYNRFMRVSQPFESAITRRPSPPAWVACPCISRLSLGTPRTVTTQSHRPSCPTMMKAARRV